MRCGGLILFVAFALPLTAPAATVQDVVDLVSQAEYTNFHANSLCTHLGDNRGFTWSDDLYHPTEQHELAKTNIYNKFASYGLNPLLEEFPYYEVFTGCNVVATLPGTVYPEQIYIVGAHYDSVDNPGADDNASGVAGMIEAARVLSQFQFECTIKFVAFDLEEQILGGSRYYADIHATDDIRGMISVDMIGWNINRHYQIEEADAMVYSACPNSQSMAVRQGLADSLLTYGSLTTGIGYTNRSDHAPFADWGSALLIEPEFDHNPYYHRQSDALESQCLYSLGGGAQILDDYIDYAYATNMTRGVVGYLATQAVLVPEPSTCCLCLIAFGFLWSAAIHRRFRTRAFTRT